MNEFVCYLPSYNDNELVRESLATCGDWDCVISDNASSEPHRSALAALACDRVRVVRQEESLGRVGNWKFCVDHFIASGATWMKFLLAGDRHKATTLDVYRRAILAYPEARFIVGRIENIAVGAWGLWSPTNVTALTAPQETMEFAARNGNVFHGLLAPLIHIEAVRDGVDFGENLLSYCADLHFLLSIARRVPTLYVAEPVGEFVFANRKHFSAGQHGLEHVLEEGLMRLRAADHYLELSGDRATRDALGVAIAQWTIGSLSLLLEPAG